MNFYFPTWDTMKRLYLSEPQTELQLFAFALLIRQMTDVHDLVSEEFSVQGTLWNRMLLKFVNISTEKITSISQCD